MQWLIYCVFIFLYIAVTFFGLGPVFIADGSPEERIATLGVVVVVYAVITWVLIIYNQKRAN